MTKILIDPSFVEDTGKEFIASKDEIMSLISQSMSEINSLRGQFVGTRATRLYNQWDALSPKLSRTIETLQIAGDLLKQLSSDVTAIDSNSK